jgi:hypothetical protein
MSNKPTGQTNQLISNFTREDLLFRGQTGGPSFVRVQKYFERRPQKGGKCITGESTPAQDAADTLYNLFHYLAILRVEHERLVQAMSTKTDFGETPKERRSRIRRQYKDSETCWERYRHDVTVVAAAILGAIDFFVRDGDDPFTTFSEVITDGTAVSALPWVSRSFPARPTQRQQP